MSSRDLLINRERREGEPYYLIFKSNRDQRAISYSTPSRILRHMCE